MFFSKKSSNPEGENVAKKSIRKMDRVVTGVLLSGVVASIYGVKKLRERNTPEHEQEEAQKPEVKRGFWSHIFLKK